MVGGAFKKGKRDTCWFRVTEERLPRELEDIQFMWDWNMYDSLSKGKIITIITRKNPASNERKK